jgi:hypothetical protein
MSLGPEDPYRNPYAFAVRQTGRLPEAPWYQGHGTMRIQPEPVVNTEPTRLNWLPHSRWFATRNWRSPNWAPHLGARASYTGWGFPSTWFTLRLPLAQPDTQTALSRRYRPVIQKFAQLGGSQIRIPGVFVPIRPTGPGTFGGGVA